MAEEFITVWARFVAHAWLLPRLGVAALVASLLGWERESRDRPAGLRTHLVIGVAAALFVGLAEILVASYQRSGLDVRMDPLRITEAVVTGVGFVAAGTIFVGGRGVSGLTTAASLLTTAALGVACGMGLYLLALITALALCVLLRVLLRWEYHLGRKRTTAARAATEREEH